MYVHVYKCVFVRVRVRVCMCVCVTWRAQSSLWAESSNGARKDPSEEYLHTHTHTHTHTHARTHTSTQAHKHTRPCAVKLSPN